MSHVFLIAMKSATFMTLMVILLREVPRLALFSVLGKNGGSGESGEQHVAAASKRMKFKGLAGLLTFP